MDYKDVISGQDYDNFWSLAKRHLISIILKKYLIDLHLQCTKKSKEILEIGASIGEHLPILNQYGRVYALDVNTKALNKIPEKICYEKRLADARNIPYPDEMFDLVVALDVMEHIEDDVKVVDEVFRVMKKGGFLLILVPACPFLFSSHDIALSHLRRYKKKNIIKLLSSFKKLLLSYWNLVFFIPIAILRLIRKKEGNAEDIVLFPRLLNQFLFSFLRIENNLIKKGLILPMGLSLVGVFLK